ncbi:MAG: hypothetical protein ACYCTE_00940 [Acidimicrobiales bacterium]
MGTRQTRDASGTRLSALDRAGNRDAQRAPDTRALRALRSRQGAVAAAVAVARSQATGGAGGYGQGALRC